MKRKSLILIALTFLITPVVLLADINEVLDTIYSGQTAPLKESVWLVLVGAGVIPEEGSSDLSAVDPYLKEKKWTGGPTLTAGQLAVLLMENFDLPRGLMYRITGAPRYALKDLKYYGVISGSTNEDRNVSGFELINSLNSVLEEDRI